MMTQNSSEINKAILDDPSENKENIGRFINQEKEHSYDLIKNNYKLIKRASIENLKKAF